MSAQLDSFVHACLARGIPRVTIREKLREGGWTADEIEAALAQYAEIVFEIPVPRRRAYLPARETFFYLVLFATLYTSAINAGQILFLLIERLFPDRAWAPDAVIEIAAQARRATAALFIAFPVFLLASRWVAAMVAREPSKRGSRIRKWLTYVTLFVAAMVFVGNLIVLVSGLLSGEITTRFVLKVLVVFLIAGTVFAHYAGDLRREEQATPLPAAKPALFARIAVAGGVAVIVAGFFASGSPLEARLRKLDHDRLQALQQISRGVRTYYERFRVLPESLDPLLNEPDTFVSETLVDPVTRDRFEYRVLDRATGKYELCAVFQASDTTGGRYYRFVPSDLWKHGVGRHCFAITIGPPPNFPAKPERGF